MAPSHYLNQCWNIINWTPTHNFSEIPIEIHTFSLKKIHLKMASEKWHPFCICLNVLRLWPLSDMSVVLTGQGATPVQGAPGWLAPNPVRGMRRPPSGPMQLQKLQFQSVIYGNPEHSNWHQSFPTHIWLFLAQCGYQDHASGRNAKLQKIYQYFVG